MTPDLIHAVDEIRCHVGDYERAEAYYLGEVDEVFVSPAVKRALRGEVCGFDINLARRPVDAVLDRLRISAVSVPDNEQATRWLVDTIWSPNRMDRVSKRVHRAALSMGDGYITVWPGEDDDTVELHYNSPNTTRVFYSPENDRVKSHAARLWCEGHGDQRIYRCDLYYPDRIERYVTEPGKKGDEAGEWQQYAPEGESWPLDNPYGEVPIFHWRTGEPYGRPEHKGAFGPQNAITKLSATLMSTIDFQGFPQRYQLLNPPTATAEGMFEFGADDTGNPDDADSALTSGPGTVWKLDAKGVGQFDPANVQAFLEPLSFYARAMAASTATPLRFFEPSGDVPSGESLRADDAPLARRIEDREELFADEWRDCLAFAALVAGQPLPEVDVKWAPAQTVEDEAGWRTALLKQQAGVPARQTLVEAGYLSDLVDGWAEGSDKTNLDARVTTLANIGKALQSLGAAAQLGVVDQTAVNTIIDQVMGDLVREPTE